MIISLKKINSLTLIAFKLSCMQHALLDKILSMLSSVKTDKGQLQKILYFMESEILPGIMKDKGDNIRIPKQYEKPAALIADSISAGLVCHLNMDTLEVEEYHANIDIEEWEDVTGEKVTPKYTEWKRTLYFEPMDSSASFRIMEDFASQLDNETISNRLMNILSRKKPFAHFNDYIHNSDYKEAWFAYKKTVYENQVREIIYNELNRL